MEKGEKIIIAGGGLGGLTLAWLLFQKGIPATVLEASSRLGGRIQTIKGNLDTPLELGATWFSDLHPNLLWLLNNLGLKKYPQYSEGISLFETRSFEPPQHFFVPASESPSYRIAGGTGALIAALLQGLPAENIVTNAPVTAITASGHELFVKTADGGMRAAGNIVVCMPPQLAASKIKFTPALPEAVQRVLPEVQTWMAGALKFTLEYTEPFWRTEGYSGMLYSHAGIITEMYDHTNFEEDKFGFTGFLNSSAAAYPQAIRKELVLQQLEPLLGQNVQRPAGYFDKVWADAFVLQGNPVFQRPHHHNGHPLLQLPYMEERLFFCGTETATAFAGYMEGAVIAAKRLAAQLT
ncbi:flavin monoamine oxidase family protein [Niabella aurantiaca]|uniref:flavin monoamine oxidase family protein n=1 Tax=Niabella aurantiaca TaxID=379900 RepID=UPI0003635F90|nr:FAD-dependent oxidoreductase [Niabella aurantiaca]